MPSPPSSPQSIIIAKEWDGLRFEYGQLREVGEFDFTMPQQAISVAFAPHEEVTWSVDGGSRKTTPLPAGSVFVYGDRDFTWHKRERESEYANFLFDNDWLQSVASDNQIELSTSSSGTLSFDTKLIFPDPTILHVSQLLKQEVQVGGAGSKMIVESLRNVLAVHLLRNYICTQTGTQTGTQIAEQEQTEIARSALDAFQVQRVKDYIEENLAEDLAIAQLAAIIPMSQYHFARAFKATIGQTPHKYVVQRRIERAKVLLSVTELPILEIAAQTGFSNPSHFTSQFRKHAGATPRQYRNI
ncbi:MAG: AraC family transcriptional regulator [Cyanobacteria bacterium J06626_6]